MSRVPFAHLGLRRSSFLTTKISLKTPYSSLLKAGSQRSLVSKSKLAIKKSKNWRVPLPKASPVGAFVFLAFFLVSIYSSVTGSFTSSASFLGSLVRARSNDCFSSEMNYILSFSLLTESISWVRVLSLTIRLSYSVF